MSKPLVADELLSRLPGLDQLWAATKGRPEVRIAVLDGPVDSASLAGARLAASGVVEHGTHVQSVIAGSADSFIPGLAPGCTVFSVPIFEAGGDAGPTCTQERLAHGIHAALESGANIINISAAQQADLLSLSNALSDALQEAEARDTLVVAAVGNHGCACDTIPASVPGVLAVGAHDNEGVPLLSSNWGPNHRAQGVTAPGRDVPGACVGGGLCRASGTSFAAAIVSGVAGLLMSAEVEAGLQPSGSRIRRVLIDSSIPPQAATAEFGSTHLAGRLDLLRATERIISLTNGSGEDTLASRSVPERSSNAASQPQAMSRHTDSGHLVEPPAPPAVSTAQLPAILPAHEDCGCGGGGAAKCSCSDAGGKGMQLVYAIGGLGVSYLSEARRDSIWRILNQSDEDEAPKTKSTRGRGAKPAEQDGEPPDRDEGVPIPITDETLAGLLRQKPYLTQSIVWTLSRGDAPMYAILPAGAFASDAYAWLLSRWSNPDIDFVAIPGIVAGKVTLYDGTQVDAVIPDQRGMVGWNTGKYEAALRRAWKSRNPDAPNEAADREIKRFLDKICFSIRNRGMTPRDRAINAAATNAFNFSEVIVEAGAEGLSFRDVDAERSPISRAGSESYDVLLTFFDPARRLEKASLRTRFTVDVSDTVPVVIGKPESWYEY